MQGNSSINLNGKTLTLNGTFSGSVTAGLNGSSSSNVVIAGKVGDLYFVAGGESINNYTVNSSKSVNLKNDLSISGSLEVGGVLNLDTKVVSGNGSFNVNSGGKITIGSSEGIAASGNTGNIQTSTRNFNSGGIYEYNGSSAQVTGTGLPASVSEGLIINNSSGVSLTNNISISGTNNSVATGSTFTVPLGVLGFSRNHQCIRYLE